MIVDRYISKDNAKNESVINEISDIPGEAEGKCGFPLRSYMDIVCVVGGMAGRRGGGRVSPRAALQELSEAAGPTSASPRLPYGKPSFARAPALGLNPHTLSSSI